MPFMLLINEARGQRAATPPDEAHRRYDAMMAFGAGLAERGVLIRAESLRPDEHAVRIRRPAPAAALALVDGPFAEAKELIAGYTLIQVQSREEALEWSRRFPNPVGEGLEAEIEVRQLFELEDFPAEMVAPFRELEQERPEP